MKKEIERKYESKESLATFNPVPQLNFTRGETIGWKQWNENRPPPSGRYAIWDARLIDPSKIQIWTYRSGKGRDAPAHGQWFNEGNWPADGAPTWYHALPSLPVPQH